MLGVFFVLFSYSQDFDELLWMRSVDFVTLCHRFIFARSKPSGMTMMMMTMAMMMNRMMMIMMMMVMMMMNTTLSFSS